MEWKLELNLQTKTILADGSEFLMDWIKLVTDLIDKEYDDNEQETSETKTEAFASKTNVFAFASRSKGKAKPRRRTSACSSRWTVLICENDLEPISSQELNRISLAQWQKHLSTLLRHGDLPREEDGAIVFWRLKDYLRNDSKNSQHWSDEMWKSKMQGGGGNKKVFQYCTDPSGQEIVHLSSPSRSFWTQSRWSFTTGQCANSGQFLRLHLAHRVCNQFTLHHKFRIDTGEDKFWARKDRQYSLRLWIPWTRNTKIRSSLICPNHVLHGTSRKRGKDTKTRCIGSIYSLLNVKDSNSIKPRCNAIVLYDTLPAYCISKVVVMESGEIIYEKEKSVTSASSKDFLQR